MMEAIPAPLSSVALTAALLPALCAFVSTSIAVVLGTIPLRQLEPDAHWSLLARYLAPVRNSYALLMFWMLLASWLMSDHMPEVINTSWAQPLMLFATFFGFRSGKWLALRGISLPKAAGRGTWKASVTKVILFPGGSASLLIVVLTWNRELDLTSICIAAAVMLVVVGMIMGGSVALLRAAGLATPVEKPMEEITRSLATNSGVPLRHVMRLDITMANAFAFPWTRDIAFTDAALNVLSAAELGSVVQHELGHLKENVSTRLARMTGLLGIFVLSLSPTALRGGQFKTYLILVMAWIVILRLASSHHKRLEIEADRHAMDAESEAGIYARALEKIHFVSLIPAVTSPKLHYPSLYDRMQDAGVTPDFPRPAPPNRILGLSIGLLGTLMFILLLKNSYDWFQSF